MIKTLNEEFVDFCYQNGAVVVFYENFNEWQLYFELLDKRYIFCDLSSSLHMSFLNFSFIVLNKIPNLDVVHRKPAFDLNSVFVYEFFDLSITHDSWSSVELEYAFKTLEKYWALRTLKPIDLLKEIKNENDITR